MTPHGAPLPALVRLVFRGIAAATGKIGAFAGVFLFPILMHAGGLMRAEAAAGASIVGLAITLWMLPETKRRSLEELSDLTVASGPVITRA